MPSNGLKIRRKVVDERIATEDPPDEMKKELERLFA